MFVKKSSIYPAMKETPFPFRNFCTAIFLWIFSFFGLKRSYDVIAVLGVRFGTAPYGSKSSSLEWHLCRYLLACSSLSTYIHSLPGRVRRHSVSTMRSEAQFFPPHFLRKSRSREAIDYWVETAISKLAASQGTVSEGNKMADTCGKARPNKVYSADLPRHACWVIEYV